MANKRRPQGDGTIRKRSDGRWEARLVIGHKKDGSPMYKSVFAKTREECEEKLAKLIKTMKAEIAEMKKAVNA